MVNAGRVGCIATPFILTLGALICLVIIFVAGTMQGNRTTGDAYFLKIDTSNFTLSSVEDKLNLDADLSVLDGSIDKAKEALGVHDYYTIYLRNYCAWNGNKEYSYCSPRKTAFWFDPFDIWGLNTTSMGIDADDVLPKEFRDGLKTYKAASIAMFYLYAIALGATVLGLLVSISAIFSRLGSFATTFVVSLATLCLVIASSAATGIFIILGKVVRDNLDDYGISASFGRRAIVVSWVGSAFAAAAVIFWFASMCFCSGRSPYHPGSKDARRTRAEKTPYTYERVGSPYLGPQGGQAVPLNTMHSAKAPAHTKSPAGAYEPFRVQRV